MHSGAASVMVAAKHAREPTHREEEVLRRRHEGGAVALERTAGDDAVHMRVGIEGLAPSVQHHDDAELGIPTVGRKGLQGLGGALKQQPRQGDGVIAAEAQQRLGEREDDMEVLDRQQLQLPCLHPGGALRAAALGAFAIAAGVVTDRLVSAVIAAVQVPAERLGATELDGPQRLRLLRTQRVRSAVVIPVASEDIGDFEAWLRGPLRGGIQIACQTVHGNRIAVWKGRRLQSVVFEKIAVSCCLCDLFSPPSPVPRASRCLAGFGVYRRVRRHLEACSPSRDRL